MSELLKRLFGNLLFGMFLRLGKLFYNIVAVRRDVSACHFAHSEWDMYHSMDEYINDEDFIKNIDKQKEKTND